MTHSPFVPVRLKDGYGDDLVVNAAAIAAIWCNTDSGCWSLWLNGDHKVNVSGDSSAYRLEVILGDIEEAIRRDKQENNK